MPEEDTREHNFFIILICFSCICVVAVAFYFFYHKKSYDFMVETSCDPTSETCRYRDCEIADECPPNNLSYYNEYTIVASDFKACKDDNCEFACKDGTISRLKTECTTEDISGGICVVPAPKVIENENPVNLNVKTSTKK